MDWTTRCLDWEKRILSRQSLIPCPPLFPDEAQAALDVFRDLRIVDAPGSPTIAECCLPWVMDFAGSVFGAYDHSVGRRLIREFFLLVSKKNSKSTIAAGIMLTALIRNWRQSAEFLILAPTVEVANNSFGPASDMIASSEELKELFQVQTHIRTITHRTTGATLKVVAADNDTVSGKKATGVLIDELWLFGKRANAENMLREATGGLASRPEGFVIYLTTQSDEPPAGVFRQKLNYFRDIRDGKIQDNKRLGVLYEFPPDMVKDKSYQNKDYFYVTNPNLGASVDEEFLTSQFDEAERAGEESLCGFLAKHLNVEIGLNLRSDRWIGADYWQNAGLEEVTLDFILERSEVITVGIDGGGADDLLGLAVIGREAGTRRWLHWAHAWAHPEALARRKSEVARYRDFEKDGDLTVIGDYPEDLDGVIAVVRRINEAGLLACVGVDTIGLAGIVDALAEIGVTEESKQVAGIGQGYVLTGAIKGLERKLIDGTFVHGARPLMSWCVGNAKIEPTKNAFLVTKQASGTAKIDPLMATFDAAKLMERNPEAKNTVSVYEERGFLIF